MRGRAAGRLAECALLATCVAAAAVWGAGAARADVPVRTRAAITPSTAKLGERVTYRGTVIVHGGAGPVAIRWSDPERTEALAWGALEPRYVRGRAPARTGAGRGEPPPGAADFDTAYVTANLQIFDTGVVSVPGLEFQMQDGSAWKSYRLPVVKMPVVPMLSAADSNATLRPLRGPLGAPWWERVPWTIVGAALLLLAAVFLLWRRLRRRHAAPAPALQPAAMLEDPGAEALRELAALRRLQLPEAGRFADHAFALTRILRRFLERTRSTPRPGHTTPELVAELRAAGLAAADVARIARLLRYWDGLKFARAETGAAEAREAEDAVEALARASRPLPRGEAA